MHRLVYVFVPPDASDAFDAARAVLQPHCNWQRATDGSQEWMPSGRFDWHILPSEDRYRYDGFDGLPGGAVRATDVDIKAGAMIGPDGAWQETDAEAYHEPAWVDWEARVRQVVADHPDWIVVGADCHS
jgi:hypothetical protein